jgi:xanthine phosphoribosyltransferase
MEQIIENQYISWSEFHRDTRQLAKKLLYTNWDLIIAVSRGGLIPASIIARELSIFLIDTICPHIVNGNIEILKAPVIKNFKNVLIIDEFVSSGRLFRKIKGCLSEAMFASVYVTKNSSKFVDFYSKELQSRDVFFPWDTILSWIPPILSKP